MYIWRLNPAFIVSKDGAGLLGKGTGSTAGVTISYDVHLVGEEGLNIRGKMSPGRGLIMLK
jgi:hypothetical protein